MWRQRLEFEHRDLHWGNVLVARTEEDFIEYTVDGCTYLVETFGVRANIIDFTLSRLQKGACICQASPFHPSSRLAPACL